jgi:hypothetical protein
MEQSTQSGAAGAQSHASTENLNQKESGRNEELAGSGAGRVATGEPKKDADERQMMAAMAQVGLENYIWLATANSDRLLSSPRLSVPTARRQRLREHRYYLIIFRSLVLHSLTRLSLAKGERYKKKDDEPSDINDDPSRIPQKFSGSAAEVGPAGLAAMVQDTPKGLGAR